MKELHYYGKLLELGKISRREFIGRAMALGTTVALATTMAGKAIAAATPKKGGRFRIGMGHGSTTDSLDPGAIENDFSIVLGYGMHNHLLEIANTGELIPELAESYSASDDAAEWTFNLRQGIEFHNGKTMDANDVVASINHHRGDDSTSAAKGIVNPIADIKADGKDTVVVTLNEGNADFPFIVSEYHLAIKPANADGSIDWQSGVGTGGYMLQNFDPGVQASMKRNPNYWKEGRAHFDESEIITITDVAARTNAVTTGEIDMMDRCDLKTLHLLEKNPDIEIAETTGYAHYTVPMRTDTPPFDDNNVRLALKYAVDREALVQTILRGHGAIGNDHPISPATAYYASDLEQRVYDPDKAMFHLKQAGLTSLTVDLSAADAAFAGAVDAAVLYKEHAKEAGITINVVPRAKRWVLVQRLDEQALGHVLLGRPADPRLDVLHGLCIGRALERHLLGARAIQQASRRGARGTRSGEARRDVRRDAAYRPRRRRRGHPRVQQLRVRPALERQARCNGGKLGSGW